MPRLRRERLALQPPNRFFEPALDGCFDLFLGSSSRQCLDGPARSVHRNVPAGHFLLAAILRHELHEDTLRTWGRTIRIAEIRAGWRILENELRAPRGLAIAALLQELQFLSQRI